MKWCAADVVDALRARYGLTETHLHQEEWSLLTEVPLRTPKLRKDGTPRTGYHAVNERRIDVLLVRNWGSGPGHERVAVEVKVSRSDYRNETPEKRAPAEHAAHRCYYAAPAGLIAPGSLPAGWGLIEVGDDGACATAVKATRRTPDCDLDYLAAVLARPGSRAEERFRRAATDVDRLPVLEAEVERLAGLLARRDETLARETARAKAARSELLGLEGAQECADCAEPITWKRGGPHDMRWTHVDPLQDGRCHRARAELVRRQQEAATGARYLAGWAGEVEPRALRSTG